MKRAVLALVLLGVLAGLTLGGYTYYRHRFPPAPPAPTAEELGRLRAERTSLQDRFRELVTGRDDQGLSQAPKAGLLIGVPTSFTSALVKNLVMGFLGEVTVTLRGLHVRKADDVQAKLLFGRRRVGRFVLDVNVREVRGRLEPGPPELTFGGNRIGVKLPVSLVDGRGRAELRFSWDSKGVANVVCGDLDVTREVRGTVTPRRYTVAGRFDLAASGGTLVADPEFGRVRLHLNVRPDEAAWRTIDELVESQGRLCRAALRKVDVKAKVEDVLAKGFHVTLPAKLFRPLVLPAGVEQSLELQGIRLSMEVKPIGLVVTPQRIWYGADIGVVRAGPPTD